MSVTIEPPNALSHPDPADAAAGAGDISSSPASDPNQVELVNRFPDEWKVSGHGLAMTAVILGAFFFLSYQPLHHSDLWGHLLYGRQIVETGSIPTREPFLPLSRGMRVVDSEWLWQVVMFGWQRDFGLAGLQFAHAFTMTLVLAVVMRRAWTLTRNAWLATAAVFLLGVLCWVNLPIARPQAAGLALYALVLFRLTAPRFSHWNWLVLPFLFGVWANTHGSFVMGLGLLGCLAAGRTIDLWWRTRRLFAPLRDPWTRRFWGLLEVSAVATLVNPYGWELHREVLTFSQNTNLADLVEWQVLPLRSWLGYVVAGVAFSMVLLSTKTKRRLSTGELLALLLLGYASLLSMRLLVWWAPLATLSVIASLSALWNRGSIVKRVASKTKTEPQPLPSGAVAAVAREDEAVPAAISPLWTVACVALVWLSFALTPFGVSLTNGKQPPVERAVSKETPLGAVTFLDRNPPKGLVFNTYEWGDYLLLGMKERPKLFVNSSAHLIPTDVWQHYMTIVEAGRDWEELLSRYGANTVVLEKSRRKNLIHKLQEDTDWKLAFDDGTAVIFTRVKPIE